MARRRKTTLRPEQWTDLPDAELLALRIRDPGLSVAGSWVEPRVNQLHDELAARGVKFHPPCYLADEWLCPDGVPNIGIPFWLAHPRLMQLERKMMLEVEGGTERWCMKLLRHEAGHALNFAYELRRRTRWRELFGPFSQPYDVFRYSSQPYSRRFVVHLQDNYAQAHPEEDFAETFAVCLDPESNWQKKYRGWPAMKKLRYVDHLIAQIGDQPPKVTDRDEVGSAGRMTSTLAQFYARRHKYAREDFPGFYDPGLQRIFVPTPSGQKSEKAARFLRRWRRQIVRSTAQWSAKRKYDINALLNVLIRRCTELDLYLQRGEVETACDVASFVTASINRIHNFEKPGEERWQRP
jgi:hypothetical protein